MQKTSVRFVDPTKSPFHKVLQKRVNQYFKEKGISRYGNGKMITKTIILAISYLGPLALIYFVPMAWPISMLLWALMGFGKAGIGMSVMHDANHGSYSQKKWVNKLMGASLNLAGASILNWKLQHNVLHHTYTNVSGMDDDIEDNFLLRFSPYTKSRWYHKAQQFYAFFFYGLTTLYWVTAKDFVQLAQYTKNKVNKQTKKENRIALLKIILVKVSYFIFFIGLPVFVFNLPFTQVLIGFLLMHFIAGITLATVFQLAHSIEETHHPLPNEDGIIEDNWAMHQIKTTANFARNSKFLTWYLGGLNYQIEHHLFPNICHVHYPDIAPIVKKTAEEFQLRYLEHKTFVRALGSHFKLMKKIV